MSVFYHNGWGTAKPVNTSFLSRRHRRVKRAAAEHLAECLHRLGLHELALLDERLEVAGGVGSDAAAEAV